MKKKKKIAKINKTKIKFFEKINKIDKSFQPDSSRKNEKRIKSTKL